MRSDRKAKTPDPARGLVLDRSVPAELVVHAGPEDVVIAAHFPRSEDRREWQDTGKGPRGAEVDIEKLSAFDAGTHGPTAAPVALGKGGQRIGGNPFRGIDFCPSERTIWPQMLAPS